MKSLFELDSLFQKLWYDKQFLSSNKSDKISHGLFLGVMLFLSFTYKAIIYLREKAYQWHIFKSYSAKIPLIIVGNITVGGTGKTPLIIALVEFLKKAGHRPGIISRGYGGKSQTYPLSVTDKTLPQEAGDEPVLLAYRTQCPVVVSPKRVEAIKYLEKEFNCTIILSDDGLQHLAMKRDIEILVVDGERQFGNGFCLPAGPLRESIKRCETVDYIMTNSTPLRHFRAGGNPEYSMHINPEAFIQLKTKKSFPVDIFKNKSAHVITGIGNPQRFLDTLNALKITLTDESHIFKDHHAFIQEDLEFNKSEKNPIIMTEKDAVKCQYLSASNDMYYLQITANLDNSFKENFMKKLNLILEKKSCV